MKAKELFSTEARDAAVKADAVKTVRTVKGPAIVTPLGSRVLTKGNVTQTAQLDFVLLAAFGISEASPVHVTQVAQFADSLGFDLTAKGLTAKARILKHVKDNELATVDGNVITVPEDQIAFWIKSYQSAYFKKLVFRFARSIADVLEIEEGDYDLLPLDQKAQFVADAYYKECIDQALEMNKPVAKTKKAKAKRS